MDIELLQKFYSGECTEEEVQVVLSWFSSTEEKEALLKQLKTSWADFEVPEGAEFESYRPAAILEGIHARIQKEENEGSIETPVSINRNRYYNIRIASIISLAFCASFVWHFFQTSVLHDQDRKSSIVVKEIPYGDRRTIILGDGTEVTLNGGSKLSFPEHFSEDKRQIKLEGEAFFEVARDKNRPFTVITGDVLTTVLGTSFNVRAGEEEIEVAVASGKVKVSHHKESCYLLPGKAVTYKENVSGLSVFDFDKKEVLSWKEGVLYFNEASFEEVEKKLERWYGVKIESVGRGNKDWEFTGSFEGQSLDNVLLSIGYVKDFSYSIKGSLVKIEFKDS